jgi:hypothetical protein
VKINPNLNERNVEDGAVFIDKQSAFSIKSNTTLLF